MTDKSPIPDRARTFLRERIMSYEQLEVLFLLRRTREKWTAEAVGTRIRVPLYAAQEALEHLSRERLLETDQNPEPPSFRYAPFDPQLADIVEELFTGWESHRLDIMKLMNANAIERVRTEAMRTFADAFILKRKKDHDG